MKLRHINIEPICKLCNKTFKNLNALCSHFQKVHHLSCKEYYDQFIKDKNEGYCVLCNKETRFTNKLRYGYSECCSNFCATHLKARNEKIKETRLKNTAWFPNGVLPRSITKDKYIARTGHDYLYNSEESKELHRIKNYDNVFKKYYKIIEKHNCKLLEYSNLIYKCYCNKCNNEFYISNQALKIRLYNNSVLCTNCNHIMPIVSTSENGIYDFIKTIYNYKIIKNDRKKLNGKELDIYLPDLNLAFEFDGKYWHADPNLYKDTDLINGKYAYEIWQKDEEKNILCKNLGIQLVRIKELDWLCNQELIKTKISKIINDCINKY